METFYIYIMTNKWKSVLYIGVTNDLERRVFEHKGRFDKKSFTARYNCDRLVYYEGHPSILEAIAREKGLKKYKREWKDELINNFNPEWVDLAADWFDPKEFEMYRKFDKE